MNTEFNASATSAGALISTNLFEVPPFQREYAWGPDEYAEFWDDISRSLGDRSYFLGLVILTGEASRRKQVVDGQQRLITITLMASALYREAVANGRNALADRIRADFLQAINYDTDEMEPRILLADAEDNRTLQRIVEGDLDTVIDGGAGDDNLSSAIAAAHEYLSERLHADLAADPFRRLGIWTEFLSNRLQFAVFIHPDPASAYRVFEVINTRGKELTTADLLKNYLLSQTAERDRQRQYDRWQKLSRPLSAIGPNTFVQYIRHVVTVRAGHVLPKDLFDFLAQRRPGTNDAPPVGQLLDLLEERLPLYLQMIDPTLDGPAPTEALKVFGALNELNVIVVRPLLLAISEVPDTQPGMERVLELVVRRIVVGNLGTGNVERRLGDAARSVHERGTWEPALASLRDLNPSRDEFATQAMRRGLNKGTLQFLRRSVVQRTKTPEAVGYLHFIRPRQVAAWPGFDEEDVAFWGSTLGNSLLARVPRRPMGASTWDGVLENLLPQAVDGEWVGQLRAQESWDTEAVAALGASLAEAAALVWY